MSFAITVCLPFPVALSQAFFISSFISFSSFSCTSPAVLFPCAFISSFSLLTTNILYHLFLCLLCVLYIFFVVFIAEKGFWGFWVCFWKSLYSS